MNTIIPVIEKMLYQSTRTYVCYLESEDKRFVPRYPNDYPEVAKVLSRLIQRKLDNNPKALFILKLNGYFPSLLPRLVISQLKYGENLLIQLPTKKIDTLWHDSKGIVEILQQSTCLDCSNFQKEMILKDAIKLAEQQRHLSRQKRSFLVFLQECLPS